MNINKICMFLIVVIIFSGVSSAAQQVWVEENPNATSLKYADITATINVKIKNNDDQVQYFKMSQAYQGSLANESKIYWTIVWTSPRAVKMVKSRYPELGGDYGWKLYPGQSRSICFKLRAYGLGGQIPAYIVNTHSSNNTYWPIVNEPGLMASWFFPDEIELLNPSLDLKSWRGTFTFRLVNVDSKRVSGIVRAPIVPIQSKLTYSNPKAFIDNDLAMDTNVAAWDVTMNPHTYRYFTYTYQWPSSGSSSTTASASYQSLPTSNGNSTPTSVPSKSTGAPYGLFIVGTLVTLAGIGYAKFLR